MFMFFLLLWVAEYLIQFEVNRHNTLLPECKQFAITIENLPKLDQKLTIQNLKAELWQHLINCLEQVEGNTNEKDLGTPEIVDIQFALEDYSYLEYVQTIISSTRRIEQINLEITELEEESNEDEE